MMAIRAIQSNENESKTDLVSNNYVENKQIFLRNRSASILEDASKHEDDLEFDTLSLDVR